MKKVLRLTESEMVNLIKKTINESAKSEEKTSDVLLRSLYSLRNSINDGDMEESKKKIDKMLSIIRNMD